jgi:hypothetical protein
MSARVPEKDDMDCPKREARLPSEGIGGHQPRRLARSGLEVDMNGLQTDPATLERGPASASQDAFTTRRLARPARPKRLERAMRCVSSGYLSGGCSCRASIPAAVVSTAWKREQLAGGGDGFFEFDWRGETWLGYGVPGRGVRGVYCPEHTAERSERSTPQLHGSGSSDGELLSAA